MQHAPGKNPAAVRPIAAALLAILVGIGLSRFAYSPLIPAIVEAGWFSAAAAAYLGAANLAGYLLGAIGGRWAARWTTPATALRGCMMVSALAFAASAVPVSFSWFFLWRLLSGVTGGALMVLAAPTVLPHVPAARRGFAAGAIFAGVGLGIVLSGTLVPWLLGYGLPQTWIGLAALSLAATGLSWRWWPKTSAAAAAPKGPQAASGGELRDPALMAIYASYGLIAVGLVPHMVFLVDFVARGLGQGIEVGARYWVVFGLGALLGPLAAGRLADRIGFGAALRCVLVLHVVSVALPAISQSSAALILSSLFVGSAVSGTVPLVLGQTQQCVSAPEKQRTAWSIATAAFALGQAAAGYLYSYVFAASGGDFALLFVLGSAALFLALATNALLLAAPGRNSRNRGMGCDPALQPTGKDRR